MAMSRAQSGRYGKETVKQELAAKGFVVSQEDSRSNRLLARDKATGKVYRIQAATKQDEKPWSAFYFEGIKEECHDLLFFILFEQPKHCFYIVPSKALASMEADKNGFADVDGRYLNNWNLLKS
ncbi:MAG: hypothetical protein LBV49_06745 [Azonexus sp.]|nr:hypothetical protein [Azonexus sp.]